MTINALDRDSSESLTERVPSRSLIGINPFLDRAR
jgi:hypothetical protein